jgi:hypothetical protein
VLALCARRGIELSSQHLLGRYWESSPKRQNLEKLLFTSAELFRREGIPCPRNLAQIAESLRARYAGLSSTAEVRLTSGPVVAVTDMRAALQQFAGSVEQAIGKPESLRRWKSVAADQLIYRICLTSCFPQSKRELVFKQTQGAASDQDRAGVLLAGGEKEACRHRRQRNAGIGGSLCSPVHGLLPEKAAATTAYRLERLSTESRLVPTEQEVSVRRIELSPVLWIDFTARRVLNII